MTTSKKQKVQEVQDLLDRDNVARQIADTWTEWKISRRRWEDEKREIREYIFATDTTKTTNASLPWKNKTTIPKLAQIRDNLHANYMAHLFPRRQWFKWLASERDEEAKSKREAIEAYMQTKIDDSDFRDVMSQLVLDYIDYGNAFAEVVFEANEVTLQGGVSVNGYVGPRVVRISPMDIVFDITASHFEDSPNIVRQIKTLGQLNRDMSNLATSQSEQDEIKAIISYVKEVRQGLSAFPEGLVDEAAGFSVDGFNTIQSYYRSGYVEILRFEGDLYDAESGTLHENQIIVVVDRSKVLWMGESQSWFGTTNKQHVGWRQRPDNLMAMGPLDNLVGMQYRIDHLENIKADVFDLIAYPPLGIKGEVDAFEWGPLEQIFMEGDASVELLSPKAEAMNADTQIARYEYLMEQLAGAPRQAMGIRTPGEKTAFEVSTLQNAASRVFENKTKQFEAIFVEPLLNKMLESARRHLATGISVRQVDTTFGIETFLDIEPDDIKAAGKLRPIGARHFAENASLAQSIVNMYQSGIMNDPAVSVHISGKSIAKIIEEVMEVREYDISQPNIRVIEQAETAQLQQTVQSELQKGQAAGEAFLGDVPPSTDKNEQS